MTARWQSAPFGIKAWIVLTAVMLAVVALPGLPNLEGTSAVGAGFWWMLWCVLLLRRSRVAWWIVVVLSAWGVAVLVLGAAGPPAAGVVAFGLLYAASLLALLAPSSRSWVGSAASPPAH